MLTETVTHYAPWTDADNVTACGRPMTAALTHSLQPTCPACAATLAAEDALEATIAETPWPLDADEAALILDPVLNAGVPVQAFSATEFVADLFDYAAALSRRQVRR